MGSSRPSDFTEQGISVVKRTIIKRGARLLKRLPIGMLTSNQVVPSQKLYIAGNSLNGVKGDIDVFPYQDAFPLDQFRQNLLADWEWIVTTRNALTITHPEHGVVQFCNYLKPSLKELVRSFDFAHIQVGVEAELSFAPRINDYYFTPEWSDFRTIGDSRFLGSEYPLSSLVRLLKYFKRGDISRGRAIWAVLNIVTDIALQGFMDYEDFKDQLDAVDLGLLPEDFDALHSEELIALFESLRIDGNDTF